MVSIPELIGSESHPPNGFYRKHRLVQSIRCDGYPQPSCGYQQPPCWYRWPAQSERKLLSSWTPKRANRTYIEDLKDPGKVLLPSCDLVLIALREDESDHRIPIAMLADLPLYLCHCSVIKTWVSGSPSARIAGLAHPVRSPIPSITA